MLKKVILAAISLFVLSANANDLNPTNYHTKCSLFSDGSCVNRDEEVTLLFIHGLLHLLGYDHEIDSGEMREKEREIIKEFNLPKSLIIRTEG